MTIEQWQALGIVCGSIIALITVAGLLRRKVIVPMLETVRLVSTLVRQLVGDKDSTPRRPSLMELVTDVQSNLEQTAAEVAEVKAAQAAHLAWHASPGGKPAAAVPARPNGQRGSRT
jgi:hypothetical protein